MHRDVRTGGIGKDDFGRSVAVKANDSEEEVGMSLAKQRRLALIMNSANDGGAVIDFFQLFVISLTGFTFLRLASPAVVADL